mgnify:CR=1 FL=1
MKKALEEKDTALAKAREEVDAMTKKADDRLEELQEVKEMNDNYLKAAEDMKKQMKYENMRLNLNGIPNM